MITYYAVIVYSDMNVVKGYSNCLIPQSTVIPSLLTTSLSLIIAAVSRHLLNTNNCHSMLMSALPHLASWAPPLRVRVVGEDGVTI